LHDAGVGALLAILDSPLVTALRTGAAAAIGTQMLARPGAATVGFIGCGAQAAVVLRMLRRLRPVETVLAHDLVPGAAQGFAARAQGLGLEAAAVGLAEAAAAPIVICATWATEAFLHPGMLSRGAHLTTLGPDQPGKAEASADLLGGALVFVDDRDFACSLGAVGNVGLGPEAITATLTEVMTGKAAGRPDAEAITVFAAAGLPWQDLALAWAAHTSGLGTPFDFGG
jgi:ornithine cyclodeaminase